MRFLAALLAVMLLLPALANARSDFRPKDQETVFVPVTIDGAPVRLAMRFYLPPGEGPFPTLIFHHGSTGRGDDPKRFESFQEPPGR